MQNLLDFFYKQRDIVLFLSLEILCAWLLITYNNRYSSSFFNSSNVASASISQFSNEISQYFDLKKINEQLMSENGVLQTKLQKLQNTNKASVDTVGNYQVIKSKVINNTFNRSVNFITIAAGKKDGIEAGMGVFSAYGIVGQVKSVSTNFATIYSLLHPKLLISSKIKRTETNCTVQWDQESYNRLKLKYIPSHINLKLGDTITTSGFNSVFPEGFLIGIIDEINLEEYMTFYEAKIKLTADFTSLYQVFVIKDLLKTEKDSLLIQ